MSAVEAGEESPRDEADEPLQIPLRSVDDDPDGRAWKAEFARLWPSFRRWYDSGVGPSRPTLRNCERALEEHAPELLETWMRLAHLTRDSERAARFLSQWCPPPAISGCSQAVLAGPEPALVRNYDHAPGLFEGVVLRSRWSGSPVLALTDCLFGALDGVNDAGLCGAIAFGGDARVGEGFSAPFVLRLLLETCGTTAEAVDRLRHVRPYMAYTFTLLDASGEHATVFSGPGREPHVHRARHSTNHQETVRWEEHARRTESRERERRLAELLAQRDDLAGVVSAFHAPPLRATRFSLGFGTLYTAAYRPGLGRLDLSWPHLSWRLELEDFPLTRILVTAEERRDPSGGD